MTQFGIKNMVAGLAALVLASGCASTASTVKEDNLKTKWEEGVFPTERGTYEAVGCARAPNISLARTAAEGRARKYLAREKSGGADVVEQELYFTPVIDAGVREDGAYCVRISYTP